MISQKCWLNFRSKEGFPSSVKVNLEPSVPLRCEVKRRIPQRTSAQNSESQGRHIKEGLEELLKVSSA
ncbi:hypothetical protein QN277_015049 [Acacia crassicarpa]|uniref:Uncharacterized protein n=1 Tax=Acacia crassicarpa TaxID=499986 RepID=A0AAE1JUV5_9FABA|nr:hypothetical protein QN277_015049 [Acacia crassicarpa]